MGISVAVKNLKKILTIFFYRLEMKSNADNFCPKPGWFHFKISQLLSKNFSILNNFQAVATPHTTMTPLNLWANEEITIPNGKL